MAALRDDTLAAAQVGSKYWQAQVEQQRAALAGVQGKIVEAERRLRTTASFNEERGAIDQFWRSTIVLALLDCAIGIGRRTRLRS